jgi:hypothetical protein
MKPIDKATKRVVASQRAVMKMNVKVAPKVNASGAEPATVRRRLYG